MDFASMLYGGAEKAIDQTGQGLSQSFQQGVQNANTAAGLALQKEQLDRQTQQMQMQMQQLQTAKTEKLYDFMKGANNIQNASDRNAYLKNTIGFRNAMGLPADPGFEESVKRLGTDENQQRMATLDTYVRSRQMTAEDAIDLATNPLKADKFAQIPMTPLAFMNKRPDLTEAQQFALTQASKEKEAEANRTSRQELAAARIGVGTSKMDEATAGQIRNKFEPISKDQTALASAQDARDRVLTQLSKDPSGRSISPQDMGAMVYSLLHSELGRVNSVELSHQFNMPGIENMAQDQLVKLLGGANPNVVKGIVQRVNTAAQELDARKARLTSSYVDQIADKPKSASALKAYQEPTFRAPPDNQMHLIAGHNMTVQQMKAFAQQYPNDPAVAQMRPFIGGQ